MGLSLDEDSVPANARVWDFVVPPKSWSTFPLSSQNSAVSGRIDLPVAIAALDQRALLRRKKIDLPAVIDRRYSPWDSSKLLR